MRINIGEPVLEGLEVKTPKSCNNFSNCHDFSPLTSVEVMMYHIVAHSVRFSNDMLNVSKGTFSKKTHAPISRSLLLQSLIVTTHPCMDNQTSNLGCEFPNPQFVIS